jgi:hypothetical protein
MQGFDDQKLDKNTGEIFFYSIFFFFKNCNLFIRIISGSRSKNRNAGAVEAQKGAMKGLEPVTADSQA